MYPLTNPIIRGPWIHIYIYLLTNCIIKGTYIPKQQFGEGGGGGRWRFVQIQPLGDKSGRVGGQCPLMLHADVPHCSMSIFFHINTLIVIINDYIYRVWLLNVQACLLFAVFHFKAFNNWFLIFVFSAKLPLGDLTKYVFLSLFMEIYLTQILEFISFRYISCYSAYRIQYDHKFYKIKVYTFCKCPWIDGHIRQI